MVRSLVTLFLALAWFGCAAFAQEPTQLFYASPGSGEQVILKTAGGGTETPRTLIALQEAKAIGWSPSGRYFSFLQRRPGGAEGEYKLFAYDCVQERAITISSDDQNVVGFWWSDNSKIMVYLVGPKDGQAFDVYVHDLTPGSPAKRVNGDLKAAAAAIVCSADAAYGAFAIADPNHPKQVAIADLRTGVAWKASGDLVVESHQWSLGGAYLALVVQDGTEDGRALFIAGAADRSLRRASAPDHKIVGFSWRPGSTEVAYMTTALAAAEVPTTGEAPVRTYTRTIIYLTEAAGGEPRLVSNIANAAQFVWAPDGRYFAVGDIALDVTTGTATPSIKVGSPDGALRVPALVGNSTGSTIFVWSPDSKRLAFLRGDSLFCYSPEERRSTIIVDSRSLLVRDMAWAPDSRHIAVMTPYEEGGIAVWNVDTQDGTGRIVSHAFKTMGIIDWGPDGKSILLFMPTSPLVGSIYRLDPEGSPDNMHRIADDAITASWYPISP